MALILKPTLARIPDGRLAAAVHIDKSDGEALGRVGPIVHATEEKARRALQKELEEHLAGIAAVIHVGGEHCGHDVAVAMEHLLATVSSGQDLESGTWTVSRA
jgi:hypothetical protein